MAFIRAKKFNGRIYYYVVENKRVHGKTRQKVLRYLGRSKEVRSSREITTPDKIVENLKVKDVLDFGDVLAQHKIFQMLDIVSIINKHTHKGGGIDVGTLTEIMVINRNSEPCSRRKIPEWYRNTVLPLLLGVPPKRIYGRVLLRCLEYLQEHSTLQIQKEIYEEIIKKFDYKPTKVFYDLTTTYFEGNSCPIAEYGYSTDHREDKVQIVVGFVVDQEGILLTHSVHPGKTVSVTTIDEMTVRLKDEFGVNECILVLDRGMISDDNLELLSQREYNYVIAHKLNNKEKRFVDRAISESLWKRIDDNVKCCEYVVEEDRKRIKYVIGHNKERDAVSYWYREWCISNAEEQLKKLANSTNAGKIKDRKKIMSRVAEILKENEVKSFIRTREIRKKPYFSYDRKKEKLEKANKYSGIFIISTTRTDLHLDEVIQIYREREVIERAIRTIKSVLILQPQFVHMEESVRGYVFVCALAYQIRSVMNYIAKENGLEMSIDEAFNILVRMKIVKLVIEDTGIEIYRKKELESGEILVRDVFGLKNFEIKGI